jgi:hypothetical protein
MYFQLACPREPDYDLHILLQRIETGVEIDVLAKDPSARERRNSKEKGHPRWVTDANDYFDAEWQVRHTTSFNQLSDHDSMPAKQKWPAIESLRLQR